MGPGTAALIPVDWAKGIMKELKAYYAPDALDAVHQHVIKLLRYRETAGNIDNYLVRVDALSQINSLPFCVWKKPHCRIVK